MRVTKFLPALIYVSVVVLSFATPVRSAESESRDAMQSVYNAVAFLLVQSIRGIEGSPSQDESSIERNLAILTKASGALIAHTKGAATPDALTRSTQRIVRDTVLSFAEHWPDYAYYSLFELTGQCVACHAQSRSREQRTIGRRLMATMKADTLTPDARALLLLATREFDAALTEYEHQLLAGETDPVDAAERGLPVRYLRVALLTGAGGGIEHIKEFVDHYRLHTETPEYLQRRYAHWRTALTRLTSSIEGTPNLRRAMQIFDHATRLTLAPGDDLRAVEDLVAARLLRTILQIQTTLTPAEKAEIYFKLGVIALRTREPKPALAEMETLFAAAINTDPAGPRARTAYDLLEAYGHIGTESLARQHRSAEIVDMRALKKRLDDAGAPH